MRQHGLGGHPAVERQPAAEGVLQPGVIQYLRLHRVQCGQANLHQVRQDFGDVTVGVEDHGQICFPEDGEHSGQPWLEQGAPYAR